MNNLLSALKKNGSTPLTVTGLRGSAVALLLARTATVSSAPILAVVPSETQAAALEQDIGFFTDKPVFHYPGYDIPPYTPLSPDPSTVAGRLATLFRILNTEPPFIVIASVEALFRRVLPKDLLDRLAELVISGEETPMDELVNSLIRSGYQSASLVQTVGEFSIRGGILDVFATGFDSPLRLDFFGDTVESIRHFDPISQRSINEVEEAILLPAGDILFPDPGTDEQTSLRRRFREAATTYNWNEDDSARMLEKISSRIKFPGIEFFLPLFYPETSSPLEYLPENTLSFTIDTTGINRQASLTWERIEANFQEAGNSGTPALPPESLFVTRDGLETLLDNRKRISLYDFQSPEISNDHPSTVSPVHRTFTITSGNHTLIKQEIDLQRKKYGLLGALSNTVRVWLAQGDKVFFASKSRRKAQHLAEMFLPYHIQTSLIDAPFLPEESDCREIMLVAQPFSEGFDLPDEKLHIISENELFGEKRLQPGKRRKKKAGAPAVSFEELKTGDIVVHTSHGLGIYKGITNLILEKIAKDFLEIEYAGSDKLYVPVDRLGNITKYKGLTDRVPKIDKLGGKAWSNTKKKIKEAVWKVAMDLLDLYARRKLAEGYAFSMPDEMYHELEKSFSYEETSGQIKAINDVIDDLTSKRTMDRLVCGDVGYGKTEVAVRAAFKVIADNRQVALLVPTTVLAEQHAQTFRERFEGFPVTVESLNRFRSPSDQKKIIAGLTEGSVDIVIGTHRLLSKDVRFRRLGLLIIDEEHRFGVTHKEKLKRLRSGIDVLTLTATPIPRTLQLSLLGVRDLSIISSPPQYRRSIKTFIARYDDLVIKEAVSRELLRSGQVFVVHNRVRSIHEMAGTVQKLVPEARVAVAHGQMPGKNLEEIMVRFVRKEIDVLVCTTIIESGLDIPNANTIVITRADRLGLAEIYQLRGRVGRSSEQSYAYLLVPSMEGLSKDAQQRLRALMDYNELGGGFKLAMSDLQIRGGGNILGVSQSGTIAAIGYDLYLDLLQKTVDDLKKSSGENKDFIETEAVDPEINLNISALIPDSYITDTNQRYIAYRRCNCIDTEEGLLDFQDELRDRYGTIPLETTNLLKIMSLKQDFKKLKIAKLEQGPASLVFTFLDLTPVDPQKILQFIKQSKNRARLTPDSKLIVTLPDDSSEDSLHSAKNIIQALL